MRIYIIEDDPSVVAILEDIVEREQLGSICGSCESGIPNQGEVLALSPDIILIDLLMPHQDGISLVRDLRAGGCQSKFIMISQVTAKEMVAKAYSAGITFFLTKPLNLVEIRQVIANVTTQIQAERTLSAIGQLVQTPTVTIPTVSQTEKLRQRIQYTLSTLGMAGEKGTRDIETLCLMMIERGETASQVGVGVLCGRLGENPKSVEQRIRRSMERGLNHIASLGVEDYGNEHFTRYANRLFSFAEVRAEMASIQQGGRGGKVNLKQFLDGMLILLADS